MRYELRRIEIWPVAKIVFILSLLLGFFIGILYGGLFALISAISPSEEMMNYGPDMSLGALAVIVILFCSTLIPISYTIFSVIFVALYNLIAAWIGGFRVEFQSIDDSIKQKAPVG